MEQFQNLLSMICYTFSKELEVYYIISYNFHLILLRISNKTNLELMETLVLRKNSVFT